MSWFETDKYLREQPLPGSIRQLAGPKQTALVDVYPDGATTSGWGLLPKGKNPGFMQSYMRGKFWPRPRTMAFTKDGAPFAIVMRSVNLIALDLDRHAGGEDGFKSLLTLLDGDVPPTLAETSKSGEGRHLFYRVPDDTWDDDKGFARYDDVIGLVPGVDLRATGCVYHHSTQRWNDRPIADLPDKIRDILEDRRTRKATYHQALASAALDPDDEESVIMHDNLLQELNKPITQGKRNATLFGIGSKMHEAGYPDWEKEIERRATEVGIGSGEVAKIISNIQNYA